MTEFDFTRLGVPCTVQSANTSRVDNYKGDLRRVVRGRWPHQAEPLYCPVVVVISYYYTNDILDIDNIIKPIIDSLKDVVLGDDRQVWSVTAQKIDIAQSDIVFEDVTKELARGLMSRDDFIHVTVRWE